MSVLARVRQAVARPFRGALVRMALPMLMSAFYEGASTGRRLGTLRASTVGPNSAVMSGLPILRNRARHLVANNAWADNAEEVFVSNVIGTGIVPRWILPDEPELKEAIQEAWKTWTDEADAAGMLDFYGLQALVARGFFTSGESLARLRLRRPEDGLTVPLQVQVLEGDHLDSGSAPSQYGGNEVKLGIEFDRVGRRVAYHLSREHPGDASIMSGSGGLGTVRVPAGEILHVFHLRRPGQLRGIPRLASIIARLHMLDSYEDATLERNRMAAMFMAFIKKLTGNPSPGQAAGKDTFGNAMVSMQPGIIMDLNPDEEAQFAQPPGAEGTFEAWVQHELRACAAGAGLTYEQLTGDMRRVNYSSARVALIEFRRRCEALQHHIFVFQFCRPILHAWMDAAVLAGRIPIPTSEYFKNRAKYLRVAWHPQAWPWVDPEKDANGEVILIDNKLKARSQSISERGEDAEEVDGMIADDQAREKRLGIEKKEKAPVVAQRAAPVEREDDDDEPEAKAA